MTAQVFAFPAVAQPSSPVEERFASEAEMQAYFAGYADALADQASPDGHLVFATAAQVHAERVRRGTHLTVAT